MSKPTTMCEWRALRTEAGRCYTEATESYHGAKQARMPLGLIQELSRHRYYCADRFVRLIRRFRQLNSQVEAEISKQRGLKKECNYE